MNDFETMLTGGHPNSLGQTEDVVDLVLADKARLPDLYGCYFSDDEIVRMRTASAMKRIAINQPAWAVELMDDLQGEIAAIDQPSIQWTLALIFDLTVDRLSEAQRQRAAEIMQHNLITSDDWIVLSNSMKVLGNWAEADQTLARWLRPHAEGLATDPRKSVARNATKLLTKLGAIDPD